jgi:hypothetical protein
MTRFRKLLLVSAGAVALAVQACSSGTELNPQPLPPGDPQRDPGEKGSGGFGGDHSGGTPVALPTASPQDAGAEGGDASDGGDH